MNALYARRERARAVFPSSPVFLQSSKTPFDNPRFRHALDGMQRSPLGCPVTCLPRMSRPPLLNGAPTDALLHPTQCTRPNPTVPCFSGEQEAVAVSHRCWRHSHRMPEALRVNGDMALYSRPLFRCVIPL